MQVTILQLNYATIKLSSDWKKIHDEKQNNFVTFFIYFSKLKWQQSGNLLTLMFRKSEGENKSQICDFSRFILVTKQNK